MCSHKLISEKELICFTYNLKKTANLGKLYFLPKIHKRLSAILGRPVISNSGMPTKKVAEYLDHILKAIMQEGWCYVKDVAGIRKKIGNIGKIAEGAILVTADAVGLYPKIPHGAGLEVLIKRLHERETPRVPAEELIKMADFVLKKKFF